MRRIVTAILIAAALAVPGVVAAKPFGYMGPGRAVDSHLDHAQRIARNASTFHQTVTKPVVAPKTQNPAPPARPDSRPQSTVGFHVAP
jgi:hypothetical protein